MYQPAHGKFAVTDPVAFLAELSVVMPATLVTAGPDGMRTSILPMLFEPADGEHGMLRGHLARGNPHWRELAADGSTEAIAIFNGPDAYVSPAWYQEKRRTGKVVPTWNYTTVVAHGRLSLRHEPEWLIPHVRRLVDRHEAGRPSAWSLDDAPPDYVAIQAKAIVGLELRIERIDAKRKLSQNRSRADVEGTTAGLADGSPREQAVAAEMRRETPPGD
jgi:transcriptional regulator